MKNQNKAGAPAAKLTPEQQQVLDIVNKSKCNARQLAKLLQYCRPLEADDFAQDIFVCISIILATSDDLDSEEIGALYKCFEFARTLVDLPMIPE